MPDSVLNVSSLAYSFVIEGASNESRPEGVIELASVQVRVITLSDGYILTFQDFNVISGIEFQIVGANNPETGIVKYFDLNSNGVHTLTLRAIAQAGAQVQGTWGAQARIIVLPRAT